MPEDFLPLSILDRVPISGNLRIPTLIPLFFSEPCGTFEKAQEKRFPGFMCAPEDFLWPLGRGIMLRTELRLKSLRSERLNPLMTQRNIIQHSLSFYIFGD